MKVLLFVLIIGFVMFGGYPKLGFPDDIDFIVFKKNTIDKKEPHSPVTLNGDEIELLSQEIGYVWCSFFGLNSWDGYPSYSLNITYLDGHSEKSYLNEEEFLSSCSSSKEAFSKIDAKLTNKKFNKD